MRQFGLWKAPSAVLNGSALCYCDGMKCLTRFALALSLPLICACGSQQQQGLQTAALSDAATNCIRREAVGIAPKAVDLDTATTAIMARCNAELWAEEKAFMTKYPGFQDSAREHFKRVSAARLDQARSAVALARTN